MYIKLRLKILFFTIVFAFFGNPINAEEEEIYLKAISDQIQVITREKLVEKPDAPEATPQEAMKMIQ